MKLSCPIATKYPEPRITISSDHGGPPRPHETNNAKAHRPGAVSRKLMMSMTVVIVSYSVAMICVKWLRM
jgi:hypothetical protein